MRMSIKYSKVPGKLLTEYGRIAVHTCTSSQILKVWNLINHNPYLINQSEQQNN